MILGYWQHNGNASVNILCTCEVLSTVCYECIMSGQKRNILLVLQSYGIHSRFTLKDRFK